MELQTRQTQAATRLPSNTYSRRFGRTYHGLDSAAAASVAFQSIGKVQVDCKLCMRQTQWGELGSPASPAAIIYMDLSFDQPLDCRLANATVLVTLEPAFSDDYVQDDRTRRSKGQDIGPQMTDYYGPKHLSGEGANVAVTKILRLTPEFNVLGGGVGGMGVEHQHEVNYTTGWSFTGNLVPRQGSARTPNSSYRTLKWELCEDEISGQSKHSSVIHTGFAVEHTETLFVMRIEIQGKLQRKRDRVRKTLCHMRFPSPHTMDQGINETLVLPRPPSGLRKPLDVLALGLSHDMERRNLLRIPVQIPNPHPVSFTADTEPGVTDEQRPADPSFNAIEAMTDHRRATNESQPGYLLRAPDDTTSHAATRPGSVSSHLESRINASRLERRLGNARLPDKQMNLLDGAVNSFYDAQQNGRNIRPQWPSNGPNQQVEGRIALDSHGRQDSLDLVSHYPILFHFFHLIAVFLSIISRPGGSDPGLKDGQVKGTGLADVSQESISTAIQYPGGWPQDAV